MIFCCCSVVATPTDHTYWPHPLTTPLPRCAQSGYTSRWYHLSAGQHFCNECFEYFYRRWVWLLQELCIVSDTPPLYSNKPGHNIFTTWTSIWDREAGDRISPGPKTFLMDQYLPVWVQCTEEECSKWRKLPPSIDLRHVKQDIVKCVDCTIPEDEVSSCPELLSHTCT